MAASAPLRDRLLFLQRLPVLLKGTADDEAPCPGYVFQEVVKISHESAGSSQCLLEYLLARLHGGSGRVKLKVLKLLQHLSTRGSPAFLQLLRRCPSCIQEAAGPPDPLHGNSLYQKVRAAAQDLGSTLFSDPESPVPPSHPPQALPHAGMGSQSRPRGALQGFGYSEERPGSAGEVFLSSVQRAAEVLVHAMRPAPAGPACPAPGLRAGSYQPVVTPAPRSPRPGAVPGLGARAAQHQPGRAGGGWDELDGSGPSVQGDSNPGRASEGGSDGDLTDRTEVETLQDCQPELGLVCAVTRGPRAFLSREETRCFLKECGRLNCEVVLQLLLSRLDGPEECAQMRVLSALSSLGGSDLLSTEHVLLLARPRLHELGSGTPGPAATKATKILRHLEAACRQRPPAPGPPGPPSHAAARGGLCDLLADAVPFSRDPSLPSPQSPAPPAPPAPMDSREPPGGPASSGEQGPGSVPSPDGSLGSLFAGMELVSCAHLAGPERTPVSQRGSAMEPPAREPSVFAFLNV
ncbi:AP-4 complex accessory subunit tepsin isoform X2 [Sorex araneus]|uniref:AP-4 complex accessory subunit tepsin isoform X2 n=1 Tax=Sorex araneus TaxID=42254 RepID=UPI002433559A|nr:AP-4 complex accessory subunit tepsin isoform X2 [Sorex araneus]